MERLVDEILIPVLGGAGIFLLNYIIQNVVMFINKRKLLKIEISQEETKAMEEYALRAVLAVEEKAAAAFKANLGKWTSGTKFDFAVNMMMHFVPKMDRKDVAKWIEVAVAKECSVGTTATTNPCDCKPKPDKPNYTVTTDEPQQF